MHDIKSRMGNTFQLSRKTMKELLGAAGLTEKQFAQMGVTCPPGSTSYVDPSTGQAGCYSCGPGWVPAPTPQGGLSPSECVQAGGALPGPGTPAVPGVSPGGGPAPGPGPGPRPIDMTWSRPPDDGGQTQVPPWGFLNPVAVVPPPPPTQVDKPRYLISITIVARLLAVVEEAWEKAETLIIRGRRCDASEGDKDAAAKAAFCLSTLQAAAGPVSDLAAELCKAKAEGRDAALSEVQVAALEAFALCVGEVASISASKGSSLLEAIVGLGIPTIATTVINLVPV